MYFIRIKNICASKDTMKKVERQLPVSEKYFQIDIWEVYAEYKKNSYNSIIKRQPSLKIDKWSKDIKMPNKHTQMFNIIRC